MLYSDSSLFDVNMKIETSDGHGKSIEINFSVVTNIL